MNKITLPVQAGEKYVRRDGVIVKIVKVEAQLASYTINGVPCEVDCYALSGLASKCSFEPEDLVYDYVEPAMTAPSRARIHAAQIIAWANGAEIEFRDPKSEAGWCDICEPTWSGDWEYRVKSKTIEINGYQVPEPMRVAPTLGTPYWLLHLASPASNSWDGFQSEMLMLNAGRCHLTREGAELHAKALLSFTKAAP